MALRGQGRKVLFKKEVPGDLSLESSRHWWELRATAVGQAWIGK